MTDHSDADSLFERPKVALLGEAHWVCIQRQYHLSPRELDVAKLVCQGFNKEEIATDLKMKVGTVKTHIRNIYRRIRVSSKIEMLLKFVDTITKLSAITAISLPVPIVDVEKPQEKTSSPFGASKKV